MLMAKKNQQPAESFSRTSPPNFQERNGEGWKYQSKSKVSPSDRYRGRPKYNYARLGSPWEWLPPDKTKTPQTKRKHKMNTKTKLIPAGNPLGSLGLTARETEVLTWIVQGKTNYEIGVILSAATRTICKHVERILSKLYVENRTAAAGVAFAALANAKI
jgi:DNA-binding CsgD family transcriptional regulator